MKNKIIFFISFIAIIEFIILLTIYSEMTMTIFKKLMLDPDGNFNWYAITAIVAIASLLSSSYYTAKKYKADLISTARISWLNSVRGISTDIIFNAHRIASLVNTISYNKSLLENKKELSLEEVTTSRDDIKQFKQKINDENDDLAKSINLHKAALVEKTTLFKMYLGPNTENNKLVSESERIVKFSEGLINLYLANNIEYLPLKIGVGPLGKHGENLIDGFTNSCRIYYKTEWKKVKLGK